MGQDRWAFVFMRLYPEAPRDDGKFRCSAAKESDISHNLAVASKRSRFRTRNFWPSESDVR